MISCIEVVRLFHRRLLATAGAPSGAPAPARAARTPASITGRIATTAVAVLAYTTGFLSTGIGILVLLSRYEGEADERLALSIVGAAIALFGLLTVALAAGLRRGSGLSRLLISVFLGILALLSAVVVASSDQWDWGATATAAGAALLIVLLWTPPVARGFRQIRHSSMTDPPRAG